MGRGATNPQELLYGERAARKTLDWAEPRPDATQISEARARAAKSVPATLSLLRTHGASLPLMKVALGELNRTLAEQAVSGRSEETLYAYKLRLIDDPYPEPDQVRFLVEHTTSFLADRKQVEATVERFHSDPHLKDAILQSLIEQEARAGALEADYTLAVKTGAAFNEEQIRERFGEFEYERLSSFHPLADKLTEDHWDRAINKVYNGDQDDVDASGVGLVAQLSDGLYELYRESLTSLTRVAHQTKP